MTDVRIAQADALAAQGRTDDALTLLHAAGDGGNVDALMQAAVWYLSGSRVPRDLLKARSLIHRAVRIGHVDGALMEIALTANGNGGTATPDWKTAHALLAIAAQGDPIAHAQLQLVKAMALDAYGAPLTPPSGVVRHVGPDIRYFTKLLTPGECAHLASVAADLLEPADIVDPVTGKSRPHPVRTSDGGAIGPTREDLVVQAINARLAMASATAVRHGEPLTVLRYRPGQQYRPHLDTIAGAANQRVKTMIVYLNEGFAGGETTFPALGLSITPRGGDAILFDTVLPGAGFAPEPRAIHAGLPVERGAKWIATRWIRAATVDPWTIGADAARRVSGH